jgi:tRNA nucleotidyltransferase/poly(A) polymerase
MKIYLVGGAVRDILRNKTPEDRDYVIVGATPSKLKDLEIAMFTKVDNDGNSYVSNVGKHFPVYIHSKTNEEYALARKEKKVGEGYHGFSFEYDDSISLKDDLMRRDLTVNSIAYDSTTNEFIDPYNGIKDIQDKILRPTSKAFKEDPLRVLRAARFSSKLNFSLSQELKDACKDIALSGELSTLNNNRVKTELYKLHKESTNYETFFYAMKELHSFDIVFPSLKANYKPFHETMKQFKGSLESFEFLMFYYGDDSIVKLFNFGKTKKKLFSFLKNNIDNLYNEITNEEIIRFISVLNLDKESTENSGLKIIKETYFLIKHTKPTNLELLISCSESIKNHDFTYLKESKRIKEEVIKVKNIIINKLRKNKNE